MKQGKTRENEWGNHGKFILGILEFVGFAGI